MVGLSARRARSAGRSLRRCPHRQDRVPAGTRRGGAEGRPRTLSHFRCRCPRLFGFFRSRILPEAARRHRALARPHRSVARGGRPPAQRRALCADARPAPTTASGSGRFGASASTSRRDGERWLVCRRESGMGRPEDWLGRVHPDDLRFAAAGDRGASVGQDGSAAPRTPDSPRERHSTGGSSVAASPRAARADARRASPAR